MATLAFLFVFSFLLFICLFCFFSYLALPRWGVPLPLLIIGILHVCITFLTQYQSVSWPQLICLAPIAAPCQKDHTLISDPNWGCAIKFVVTPQSFVNSAYLTFSFLKFESRSLTKINLVHQNSSWCRTNYKTLIKMNT
jgi:hypothetical protein